MEFTKTTQSEAFDPESYMYDERGFKFVRSRLDKSDLKCVYLVVLESVNGRGLHKTKIENYAKQRAKFDQTFIKLETLGLIQEEKESRIKNGRPYVLTNRGKRFYMIYKEEISIIWKGNEKNDI